MSGTVSYEHGYFRSISSGREFQFFGAHFISTSRIDMRVGAFDRCDLEASSRYSLYVSIMTSQIFSKARKSKLLEKSSKMYLF